MRSRRTGARMRAAVAFAVALLATLAVVALGVAAVVYGEADDSPGLQGIGVFLVVAAVVASLRWRGPGA